MQYSAISKKMPNFRRFRVLALFLHIVQRQKLQKMSDKFEIDE